MKELKIIILFIIISLYIFWRAIQSSAQGCSLALHSGVISGSPQGSYVVLEFESRAITSKTSCPISHNISFTPYFIFFWFMLILFITYGLYSWIFPYNSHSSLILGSEVVEKTYSLICRPSHAVQLRPNHFRGPLGLYFLRSWHAMNENQGLRHTSHVVYHLRYPFGPALVLFYIYVIYISVTILTMGDLYWIVTVCFHTVCFHTICFHTKTSEVINEKQNEDLGVQLSDSVLTWDVKGHQLNPQHFAFITLGDPQRSRCVSTTTLHNFQPTATKEMKMIFSWSCNPWTKWES